jgi:hypothetical protein
VYLLSPWLWCRLLCAHPFGAVSSCSHFLFHVQRKICSFAPFVFSVDYPLKELCSCLNRRRSAAGTYVSPQTSLPRSFANHFDLGLLLSEKCSFLEVYMNVYGRWAPKTGLRMLIALCTEFAGLIKST